MAARDLLDLGIQRHELIEARIEGDNLDDLESVLWTVESAGDAAIGKRILKSPRTNLRCFTVIFQRMIEHSPESADPSFSPLIRIRSSTKPI